MDSLSGYEVEVTAPRLEEAVRYGGAFNDNVKFSGASCVVKFKRPVEGQFVKECCLHSRLRHPNIVQFIGVWYRQGGRDLHLVLEQMHASLDVSLETHPHIPLPIKLSVLRDVSAGLMYLHSFAPPIIHGDLTTTNILLTQDWRAKIADFGNSVDQSALRVAIAPGTLAYMPPEAINWPLKYDSNLDIFSFGTVALYVGIQTRDADRNKRSDQFQTLAATSDGECLCQIVTWCCDRDPTRRPSSHDLNIQMEQLCSAHPLPYKDMVQLLHDKSDNHCKELENRKVVMSDQRVLELQIELEITKRSMNAENDKLKMEIKEHIRKHEAFKQIIEKNHEEMIQNQRKLDQLGKEIEWLQNKSSRKSSSSTHEDYIRTLKGQVASLEEDIARLNEVIESKNRLINELQKNKADLKSMDTPRWNEDDIHEGLREHGHTCVPQDGRLAEGSNDADSNGLLQKLKVAEERIMATEESYRSAISKIEVITAERDIFAEDFRKERDDRSRVAGEKGQVASELEAAQQNISEMSAKLSRAVKEIDDLSAGLKQTTDELNRAKEEVAVKVAQVKQYQKQVEAYKQQLEQNNEKTQAFVQQLDHMSKLKEQAEIRLTEVMRGSDTKKPMNLEFKTSIRSGTPIAASHSSTSEEDSAAGTGTCSRTARGNDLGTGLCNTISPHTCLPASVAGMQQHPLSVTPTGSDRVPSRIFSPQPPPHAGPPSLDNLPHPSAMGGSQGISYPTLDQHQDAHVGSGEPTAPPDPNLTCPQCRLVFKKGEIQKFRLHVQECKYSK